MTAKTAIIAAAKNFLATPVGGWGETMQAWRRLEGEMYAGRSSAGNRLWSLPNGRATRDRNRAVGAWEALAQQEEGVDVHPSRR